VSSSGQKGDYCPPNHWKAIHVSAPSSHVWSLQRMEHVYKITMVVRPFTRDNDFVRGDFTHFISQRQDHQKCPCMVIADLVADVVPMLETFVPTFKSHHFGGKGPDIARQISNDMGVHPLFNVGKCWHVTGLWGVFDLRRGDFFDLDRACANIITTGTRDDPRQPPHTIHRRLH